VQKQFFEINGPKGIFAELVVASGWYSNSIVSRQVGEYRVIKHSSFPDYLSSNMRIYCLFPTTNRVSPFCTPFVLIKGGEKNPSSHRIGISFYYISSYWEVAKNIWAGVYISS
jgi:hypothetical protein